MTYDQWLSLGIRLAGVTSITMLLVGLQVPARLGWKEDLASLTQVNRRMMWGYASFVALTFVSLGVVTLVLHDEMLAGDRAAGVIAAFMAVWWTGRVGFDAVSIRSAPWPDGPTYAVAHVVLLAGFVAMAVVYWTVAARALVLAQ